MITAKENIDTTASKREELYSIYKKNTAIDEEIKKRHRNINSLKQELKKLKSQISDEILDVTILEEIRDSRKTFLLIDNQMKDYIQKIKDSGTLNTWKKTYDLDDENIATSMYTIKNATYTGNIIFNQNKARNFFRLDMQVSISSILLSLAKDYKKILLDVDEVVFYSKGRVVFSEKDAFEMMSDFKAKTESYFKLKKESLPYEFVDVKGIKYYAKDFLTYDDMLMDDFCISDNKISFDIAQEKEVVF